MLTGSSTASVLETRCSACGQAYQVPAHLHGRRVRCHACQSVFRVASAPGAMRSTMAAAAAQPPCIAAPLNVNFALFLILAGYIPSAAYQGYLLFQRSGPNGLLPLAIQISLLLLVAVPLGALGLNWAGDVLQYKPPKPVYLAILAVFAVPTAILNAGTILVHISGMTWWAPAALCAALPLTFLVLALFNQQGLAGDGIAFTFAVLAPGVAMVILVLVAHALGGTMLI